MSILFPVVFTATDDKKDTYLIEIPDLKGFTQGYGLENAFDMARDYMGCTLYDKPDSEIPKASNISEIDISNCEFANKGKTFISLVDFDLEAYRKKMNNKAVRRNVSIPAWLNQEVEKSHINVSRVLQEALLEKLNMA